MTGGPIDQLLALQTVQHGLNVGGVVAAEVLEDAGGGHVEAAMVGLARPVLVGLAGRLAGGGVVLVEESGQVADVEVGAPFLNGIAVRAADPEGDDDLRLTVIDRGAVADEDLAEIVVGVDAIEREIHHVLKAEDLQKLNAVHLRGGAAGPGLRGIVGEPGLAVARGVIGQRASEDGDGGIRG